MQELNNHTIRGWIKGQHRIYFNFQNMFDIVWARNTIPVVLFLLSPRGGSAKLNG